jgi:hypothetical protein
MMKSQQFVLFLFSAAGRRFRSRPHHPSVCLDGNAQMLAAAEADAIDKNPQ